MQGIVVRYSYDGDEERWRSVIDGFIAAIGNDDAVGGRFHYTVTVADDGTTRTHFGRWDSEETLAKVQSRAYFRTFTGALREMAGASLQSIRVSVAADTG